MFKTQNNKRSFNYTFINYRIWIFMDLNEQDMFCCNFSSEEHQAQKWACHIFLVAISWTFLEPHFFLDICIRNLVRFSHVQETTAWVYEDTSDTILFFNSTCVVLYKRKRNYANTLQEINTNMKAKSFLRVLYLIKKIMLFICGPYVKWNVYLCTLTSGDPRMEIGQMIKKY